MIALDTNNLVRLATGDDLVQTEAARLALRRARQRGEDVFVPYGAILECAWALSKIYGFSTVDIADFLDAFRCIQGVRIEREAGVINAVQAYREKGDFVDLLYLELAKEKEASCLLTFDKKLQALSPGFAIAPDQY